MLPPEAQGRAWEGGAGSPRAVPSPPCWEVALASPVPSDPCLGQSKSFGEFETVYLSGLRASKGQTFKGNCRREEFKPLALSPVSQAPPLRSSSQRLRRSSEPVRITSLGTGANTGSSDRVSLSTRTGALIILMRKNWNLGKGCSLGRTLPEASEQQPG